jgi:hypothetical protein
LNNPIRFIDPLGLDTTYYVPPIDPIDVYPEPDNSELKSEDEENWVDNFLKWLKGIDRYVTGNHNPRKVRKADSVDRWIQRNCDQEVVNELGQIFGHMSVDPTNANVVTDGDHFRRRKLPEVKSDKQIKEESGNKLDANGQKSTLEKNEYVAKERSRLNGYNMQKVDIAEPGDTVSLRYVHIEQGTDSIPFWHVRNRSRGKYGK